MYVPVVTDLSHRSRKRPQAILCKTHGGYKWNADNARIVKTALVWLAVVLRGTQQIVSVNICSEDLLSPTIFGLKYDEKLEVSFPQIFVIW